MQAGKAFEVEIEGVIFSVVYTKHFVERFEIDEPGRPAAGRFIDEDTIRSRIEEALPQIDEIAAGDPDAEGIIRSRTTKANMSFALRPKQGGFTLAMKNVFVGIGYHRTSAKDYMIDVNPPVKVHFKRGLSPSLREAVLADVVEKLSDFEDRTAYHLRGEMVDYWVERWGNGYFVDEADWLYDLYEVQVA